MKITLVNLSNKQRSKKAKAELKEFASYIAEELGISNHIKHIKMAYKRNWHGYYPKGQPLGGFHKLYSNGVVTIDFTKEWDRSQHCRKDVIVHELTHAKQMINKELVVFKNGKTLKWQGERFDGWKHWREAEFNKLTGNELKMYHYMLLPWEEEVTMNCHFYNKKA